MIDTGVPDNSRVLYNSFQNPRIKGKECLSYIFMDNLNYLRSLYSSGKLRPITYDNIQKTILCGSIYLGYDLYCCPECDEEKIIPHRCHSRFCTTCGSKETEVRAARISAMALDAQHRHIVFTIPEELRRFFIADRSLLHLLFVAARNTLACLFNNEKFRKERKRKFSRRSSNERYSYRNDREKVFFGAVMALHTFGRDLKWNPHIHCLVCEEAYDSASSSMKSFAFMSYEKLRKTWMYNLLELLSHEKLKGFGKLKTYFYRVNDEGFYVYARKKEKDDEDSSSTEECVRYITRYTSRPAMAESRIISYEDDRKMIRWWYNRHEDDEYVEVYEHVHDFLNNLILHCPDKNFRMVRYYGFYSNQNRSLLEKVYELYGKKMKKRKRIRNIHERKRELKKKISHLRYRANMIKSYGKDPLLCSCGAVMDYEESYNPFEGGTVNDRHYREECLREAREMGRRTGSHFYD